MKITINTKYQLQNEFKKFNRDYYSLEGYDTILDYYNEIDENAELDVIDICQNFTEYGNESHHNFDDFISDYENYYSQEEYMEDYDISPDNFDKDDYIDELIKKLEDYTIIFNLRNGDILIIDF